MIFAAVVMIIIAFLLLGLFGIGIRELYGSFFYEKF